MLVISRYKGGASKGTLYLLEMSNFTVAENFINMTTHDKLTNRLTLLLLGGLLTWSNAQMWLKNVKRQIFRTSITSVTDPKHIFDHMFVIFLCTSFKMNFCIEIRWRQQNQIYLFFSLNIFQPEFELENSTKPSWTQWGAAVSTNRLVLLPPTSAGVSLACTHIQ